MTKLLEKALEAVRQLSPEAQDHIAEAILLLADTTRAEPAPGQPAAEQPIWEIAAKIGAEVPAAEWDKVPTDLVQQLKHHLYGHTKS